MFTRPYAKAAMPDMLIILFLLLLVSCHNKTEKVHVFIRMVKFAIIVVSVACAYKQLQNAGKCLSETILHHFKV